MFVCVCVCAAAEWGKISLMVGRSDSGVVAVACGAGSRVWLQQRTSESIALLYIAAAAAAAAAAAVCSATNSHYQT